MSPGAVSNSTYVSKSTDRSGKPRSVAYSNSTRLNSDKETYKHNLKQSVGPGEYQSQTPLRECHECFASDPRLRHSRGGNSKCKDVPLIDVDSELRGYTRRASNHPLDKFIPRGFPDDRKPFCKLEKVRPCQDESMTTQDTRFSNPPSTLRGIENGFNRWEWLCQNPQERIEIPFDVQIDSRTVMKDNHRPHIPEPIDPTLALPAHMHDDRPMSDPEAFVKKCGRSRDVTTAGGSVHASLC